MSSGPSNVVPEIFASRNACRSCGAQATTAVWPARAIHPKKFAKDPEYKAQSMPNFYCDACKPSAQAKAQPATTAAK